MRFRGLVLILVLVVFAQVGFGQKRGRVSQRVITVITEPSAKVWLNEVSYGETDEKGRLVIKPVAAGSHRLRVRADGFGEYTRTLTPARRGNVRVVLKKTNDPAELAFQEAERTVSEDRAKAKKLYKKAIELRSNYPQPYIGLARLLSGADESDEALATLNALRKFRLRHPEASAVEGRIHVSLGEEEKAIKAFERAIREGGGFQPEAYTGLGLLYREKAESAGNFEDEEFYYEEAANALQKAVKQLYSAPDAIIISQFLGRIYEETEEFEKAIAVYEDFLKIFPEATEATAVRSFIVQIKKRMAER